MYLIADLLPFVAVDGVLAPRHGAHHDVAETREAPRRRAAVPSHRGAASLAKEPTPRIVVDSNRIPSLLA